MSRHRGTKLGHAGTRAPQDRRSGIATRADLSDRDRQILDLIDSGLTAIEIQARMDVSANVVAGRRALFLRCGFIEKHARRIKRKDERLAEKLQAEEYKRSLLPPDPAPPRPPKASIQEPVVAVPETDTPHGDAGCRWPIGNMSGDWRYCQAELAPRPRAAPYCAGHLRAAYVPGSSHDAQKRKREKA